MIKVENITYSINNKTLLSDINFTINKDENISIIGSNGAGKTTLIKLLNGLIKATSGKILILDKNINEYKRKELSKIISYVPQSAGYGYDFTTEEYITYGRYAYMTSFGSINEEDKKIIRNVMAETNISHLKNRKLFTMSGGERQKVFIATALAQSAPIIILDEPTVYLDPKATADINALLQRINKSKNYTMITVTHDLNYALLSKSKMLGIKESNQIFYENYLEVYNNKYFDDLFNTTFLYVKGDNDTPQLLPRNLI